MGKQNRLHRILIIKNQHFLKYMLWKWLAFYGFEDVVFCQTDEAEEILVENDFDLVVIDWDNEVEKVVFAPLYFLPDGVMVLLLSEKIVSQKYQSLIDGHVFQEDLF